MIRPLTPADAESAAAIYNHYVATSTATFQTEPVETAEWYADVTAGDAGRHGAWAIEDGGALAGFLLVSRFKARCAYNDTAEVTVYLSPGSTGRGLGPEALAYAEDHAKGAGLHALLAVVCAENDASLRAFERAGYERVGLLREVGSKFGRLLDVAYLEKLIRGPRARA